MLQNLTFTIKLNKKCRDNQPFVYKIEKNRGERAINNLPITITKLMKEHIRLLVLYKHVRTQLFSSFKN